MSTRLFIGKECTNMKLFTKIIGLFLVLLIIGGAIFYKVKYLHEAEDVIVAPRKENKVEPTVTEKVETNDKSVPEIINYDVPFTSQAPLANWDDERQQDGCEEASSIMAIRWARGDGELSKDEYLKAILDLSDYEEKTYKEYRDINVNDVIKWIFNDYFKYNKAKVKNNINKQDIINELYQGNIVLVPANGQLLHNPYFTQPGPERHMLVIKGYDNNKKEFITNDPGTKRGENYHYNEDVLFNAILAYPTGYHVEISNTPKDIIVVSK